MQKERKNTWLYWLITLPFVITMLMAGVMLLAGNKANVDGITQLGYPTYICIILGTAKLLGSIAIIQNRFKTIKEWAYAGYTFNLLGAAASHLFYGDAFSKIIIPLIILCFVLASYQLWKHPYKAREQKPVTHKNLSTI